MYKNKISNNNLYLYDDEDKHAKRKLTHRSDQFCLSTPAFERNTCLVALISKNNVTDSSAMD